MVDELDLSISAEPSYFPVIGATFARRHDGNKVANPLFGFETYAWGGESINISYLNLPKHYLDKDLKLIALEDQEFSLFYNEQELLSGHVGKSAYSFDSQFSG